MLQITIGAIIIASMSMLMHIEENERICTQEEYDNTDWNAYYANK